MKLALAAIVAALLIPVAAANADPTNHFATFTLTCGEHTLVITDKPGSSAVVTFDGQSSTSVSILKGIRFTENYGQDVVFESYKPFVEHQTTTYCSSSQAPGELLEAWTILTPRG